MNTKHDTEKTSCDTSIIKSPRHRTPDFIGIGAEKAGTTWLWKQLSKHPEISMPYPKELRYFAYRDYAPSMPLICTPYLLNANPPPGRTPIALLSAINELKCRFGTIDDYLSIFGELPINKVVGEISPQYASLSLGTIKQIHDLNHRLKIILIIRDPVERAISGAKMKITEANKEITEDAILKLATDKHQKMLSNYHRVISNYRNFFKKEDLLILLFDEIAESPQLLLKNVCEFLKVNYNASYFYSSENKIFPGKSLQLSDKTIKKIYKSYSKIFDDLMYDNPQIAEKWRTNYS